MRKLIRSLKTDNRGSAIVVVIIALAFVGVLAASAMWMSIANYRMKATDKGIKSNFYTAESVFEEIVAGLQEESSNAAGKAYTRVLENYSSAGSDTERYSNFVKYYKEELVDALHDPSDATKYRVSVITSYLDPNLYDKLITNAKTGDKLTMNPATIEESTSTMNYITLKNFKLEFTDDDGFYSVIETDIMITAPEISFTMSSPVPEVFKYAVIADKGIENNVAGETKVNGSLYAGADGIKLTSGGIRIDNADYAISMGDVLLTNTDSKLIIEQTEGDTDTQFWAKDISIGSAAGASGGTLDIDANTFIADDLTLNAASSKVKFKGKYIGYGNGGVTGGIDDAAHNSAIMINNLNSNVDMSGLTEFTVAGNSFVDLSKYYTDPTTRELFMRHNGSLTSANNIPMGESIAVKSDQIAFLVPEECIWVTWDMKSTPMTQNPVAYNSDVYSHELVTYCHGTDDTAINKIASFDESPRNSGISGQPGKELYEVMLDMPLSNGKTLNAYINSTNDIIRVFSKKTGGGAGNDEALIYYYMKMSSDSAKKFIKEYYNNNTERMSKYFAVYVQPNGPGRYELALPDESKISSQGAYVAGSKGGVNVSDNKLQDSTVNTAEDKQKLVDKVTSCIKTIDSLTWNLNEESTPDGSRDPEKSYVYENIIDSTKVKPGCYKLPDDYYAFVTTASDFDLPSGLSGNDPTKCRLLIAEGNVNITSDIDFTGVMLVKGKLTINRQSKITNVEKEFGALSELVRVLQCPLSLSDTTTPISMFRNASGYVIAGTQIMPRDDSGNVPDKVDIMNTVNYKNWIKK